MADLDDLREGADFGLGINCENQRSRELTLGHERPSVPYLQPEDRQGGYACF